MVKTDYEEVKNHNYVSNREFVCGLVEVIGNRIKLNVNSEFLTISESGFTGIIPLDSGDDAASIDKMRAAAEYFAELAQDLRQVTKLYQPQISETVTPVESEVKPRNQQQQTQHLEKIHTILEQLPEEEKAIYQGVWLWRTRKNVQNDRLRDGPCQNACVNLHNDKSHFREKGL